MQIALPSDDSEENNVVQIPAEAYLILDEGKVIPLKSAIVNIGRRLENDVVIEDHRVSRNHLQLKAVNGKYALLDLSSTGGSFVNNRRVEQCVLYPGDEISLAGYTIQYRQFNAPPRADLKKTSPLTL